MEILGTGAIAPYQTATLQAVGLNYGVRAVPDVSFNADPNTGVPSTTRFPTAASPGVPGRRHQHRHTSMGRAGRDRRPGPGHGRKGISFRHTAQADLFALPSSDFHDITMVQRYSRRLATIWSRLGPNLIGDN